MKINTIIRSIFVAMLCFSAGIGPVYAEDTDIYLTPPNVIRDDAPNILIILDNSGSMETNTISVTTPYDPATDYCGAATDCFDKNKIYWKTTSGTPSKDPSDWGDQWITSDPSGTNNNKCESSLVNLVDPATAAADTGTTYDNATGFYASDRIVQFTGDTGNGNWDNIADSRDAPIECQADGSKAKEGLSNTYVTKNNNVSFPDGTYTTNSNLEITWSSYNTPTLYAGNYLNYLKYDTSTVTKTRMEIAKDAVSNIINSNINVNLGLMVFNRNNTTPHGGRIVNRIKKLDSDWKTALSASLAEVRGYVKPDAAYGSGTSPNYTPLAETLYEAYLYLAGKDVKYGGINWKDNSGSDANYPRPYPDVCAEDDSNSAYCASYDYATINRDTITTYYDNLTDDDSYITPFQFECQQSYIIIITDGDPYKDVDANSLIDGLPGMTAYLTPNTGGTDTDEVITFGSSSANNRLDDMAGWLYENDLIANTTLKGKQRVLTYTVGFGSGISAGGEKLLQKTAEVGHGKYFTASNSIELADSLQSAIVEIQTTTSSFAAPSLSVNAFNKLYNRDEIYFALFKPSASYNWDGNIKKFHLCNTQDVIDYKCTFGEILDSYNVAAIDSATLRIKNESRSYWNSTTDGATVSKGGAGEKLFDTITATPRKLYTFRDDYSTLSSSSVMEPILNTVGNSFYDAVITNPAIVGASTATEVPNVIGWMMGYYRGAATYDATNQRWPFGDPLHSRPVAITFGKTTDGDDIIKLIVSTNDGAIHIINDTSGKEEWAFIPNEMLSRQNDLSIDADNRHTYGLDATPTFWIQDNNGNGIIEPGNTADPANPLEDKVYMYIGMRRGGNRIYAFDMTPSNTLDATSDTISPKLMWVIEGGASGTTGYSKLGYTWSAPQVRDIRVKCNSCTDTGDSESRTVLIFGGGYDTSGDTGSFGTNPTTSPYGTDTLGNAIYIADPSTGELIWWASSDPTATHELPEMTFSIPADLSLMDSNGDGAVDRIYAGDMGGQVWRIDLDNQLTTGDGADTQGYVFADLVCSRNSTSKLRACSTSVSPVVTNQDWRKIFYPVDVAQLRDPNFSSSPDYDLVAFATGNRPDPLDLETSGDNYEAIHNRIYALRDYNTGATPFLPDNVPLALVNADLVNLTTNPLQNTGDYPAVLDALVLSKGWFVDLKLESGEGITVPPLASGSTTEWVGEKGLAKAVIFDSVLYVTTYTPANNSTATITCAATEGLGVIYALGLFDATAVVDFDGDGNPDRKVDVGGGIPSELVTVIREGGVTGLVGTSGGAASPDIGNKLPRGKTFWTEE